MGVLLLNFCFLSGFLESLLPYHLLFTGNAGERWSVTVLRVTLRIGSGVTESGESPQASYLVPSSGIKGIHHHDQLCANEFC